MGLTAPNECCMLGAGDKGGGGTGNKEGSVFTVRRSEQLEDRFLWMT